MAITGDQLRMARAALRLTSREVAKITGVDKGTIIRAEFGDSPITGPSQPSKQPMRRAGLNS